MSVGLLRVFALGGLAMTISGSHKVRDRFEWRSRDRIDINSVRISEPPAPPTPPDNLFATANSTLGVECACNNTLLAEEGANPTVERTGGAWCMASTGIWSFCSNSHEPRVTTGSTGVTDYPGIYVERASTNLILHSNDMTQASVWATSGITVAQTATSPTGVANSGTHVTSAGPSSAFWQTVTATGTGATSVFIRLAAGTPANDDVKITRSGGGGWISIGSSITSTWKRFQPQDCGDEPRCVQVAGLTSSVTDPVIGIELNSATTELEFWGWQNEALSWASTPISTGAGSVTRNGERVKIALTGWNESAYSFSVNARTSTPTSVGAWYFMGFRNNSGDGEKCDIRPLNFDQIQIDCNFGPSSMSRLGTATANMTSNYIAHSSSYDGTTLSLCTSAACQTTTTGSLSGIDPTDIDLGGAPEIATGRINGVVRDVCFAKGADKCPWTP